jgi:hypothetical protein
MLLRPALAAVAAAPLLVGAPGGSADGASNGGAGSGISDPLKGLAEALGVGNGRGGWGGNGTPLA